MPLKSLPRKPRSQLLQDMTFAFGNGWFDCAECETHGFATPGHGAGQCEALFRAGYLDRQIKEEVLKWSIYTPLSFVYRFTGEPHEK